MANLQALTLALDALLNTLPHLHDYSRLNGPLPKNFLCQGENKNLGNLLPEQCPKYKTESHSSTKQSLPTTFRIPVN